MAQEQNELDQFFCALGHMLVVNVLRHLHRQLNHYIWHVVASLVREEFTNAWLGFLENFLNIITLLIPTFELNSRDLEGVHQVIVSVRQPCLIPDAIFKP